MLFKYIKFTLPSSLTLESVTIKLELLLIIISQKDSIVFFIGPCVAINKFICSAFSIGAYFEINYIKLFLFLFLFKNKTTKKEKKFNLHE